MQPPIIINDSKSIDAAGDVRVYDTVELAEKSLERDDAKDSQLHAFDSTGLRLKIVANQGWPNGGAHLIKAEAIPGHEDVLRAILKDFLVKLGVPKETAEGMTLESLAVAARERSPNPYSGQKTKR